MRERRFAWLSASLLLFGCAPAEAYRPLGPTAPMLQTQPGGGTHGRGPAGASTAIGVPLLDAPAVFGIDVLASSPSLAPAAPPPANEGLHADVDPHNDHVPGPPPALEECHERLRAAGVRFFEAHTGVRREQGVVVCGAPQAVRYRWGPRYLRYNRNPMVSCQMALALVDFERIVQQEARRHLGTKVRRVEHLGTYNCRKMARFDRRSEHSFANGIDIKRFRLANGETVDVRRDFHPNVPDTKNAKSQFLRALSRRLYDEGVFSSVITPFFDDLHDNHLHLDLARYRVDGTRPDSDDHPPPARTPGSSGPATNSAP